MDPITIMALISAAIAIAQKGIGLYNDLQSGKIKPEDIDPETLRMPTVAEIEQMVKDGKL